MQTKSMLMLPPKALSSCIAAAVFRDTRGAALDDKDRFNYFPASPLISATNVLAGELKLAPEISNLDAVYQSNSQPQQFIMTCENGPTASWSPGPVAAVTICFYPDAWIKLGYDLNPVILSQTLSNSLTAFDNIDDPETSWNKFCTTFEPIWNDARASGGLPSWIGSDRLSDWSHHLATRAAMAGAGRSIRTIERQFKRWTGHDRRTIEYYATIENLHAHVVTNPNATPAAIANDTGYSDQSHMGRAVRRTTGFSPARLNKLIETEEPFWCYRLMGNRF